MPLNRRSVLAGAFAAALPRSSFAAPAFTPRGLRDDARILRQAYTAMHPGLYRYNSPSQMAARFDRLDQQMAGATSQRHAFLALTHLTAAIRCGHSYPSPYNMSDAAVRALFGGADRVPFCFEWIDGEMVLTDACPIAPLPKGTRVTAIDGVSSHNMLRRLLPLARADGANHAKRISSMAVSGQDRFPAFDVYRPMLWPSSRPEIILKVILPGGAPRNLTVTTFKGGEARGGLIPRTDDRAPWTFRIDADGIGILTMPDWALYESPFPWRAFINDSMDQLVAARARGLIIDVRDNEGGMDCGDLVLARLISRDTALPAYDSYTRYRTAPSALKPYLKTWDRSFLDWGADARDPNASGLYRMTRFDDRPGGSVITPKGPRFTGKVAVLVGAANSSATFQFALAVRSMGVGVLVGQPTGGNRRGINGGAFFFLQLPNSGLEVDLPLIATLPRSPQPDAGLLPDIVVKRSALAIAEGRDLELAAAKRWLT